MHNNDLLATVTPRSAGAAALEAVPVSVRRLTNGGISLTVSRSADDVLRDHAELELRLSLPDHSHSCAIACVVRDRSAFDGAWLYGCEYDWSATMDPLGAVEDLLEYMLDD